MNKLIFCLTIFLTNLLCIANERSGECPPWINGDNPPKSNDSFYYLKSEGSGTSVNDAIKDADLMLVSTLMREKGLHVSGSQIERELYRNNNGIIDERHISDYNYEFKFGDVYLAFKAVDKYWVKKGNLYDCQVLYEVAYNPKSVKYDPVEYSSKYGARGLWRSAIIPGWGQMYKKSYAKGGIILAAEAGTITTALIYNNLYSSYVKKSHSTTDVNAIKFYQNKANTCQNIRNGFFIAASAIYVYNIVDAIAAKGKLRYVKPKGKSSFALTPYFNQEFSTGVFLSYIF